MPSFTIRFVYFYLPITRSEIHGRKNMAPFRQSSVSSIRGRDKRRDAIQLAIIDTKETPTTVFSYEHNAQKISGVVRIACFSVRHLTRVTSLTNNSSVTPKFLAGHQATDVSEITHRCPSFSGSAWPMHIPLGMIWFRTAGW
ncbi:hypothetical protein TNCV_1126061 [Trichonephila clavipes]|nr:hypothetical protein TNCV_1126061 [Trichonephila clavipes]